MTENKNTVKIANFPCAVFVEFHMNYQEICYNIAKVEIQDSGFQDY